MKRINIQIPNENNNHTQAGKDNNETNINTIRMKVNTEHLPLTRDELIYLYDIYHTRPTLTNLENEELQKIICHRNIKQDFAIIFNCTRDEVTLFEEEFLANPSQYVVLLDNLDLSISQYYPKLKYVKGSITFYGTKLNSNNLPSLEVIGGHAYFGELTDATSLTKLTYIGGYADFKWLTDSDGLNNLTYIGGYADFGNLKDATGLCNLERIDGAAMFQSLISSKGLEKLKYTFGTAHFDSLTDAIYLNNLERIGGSAKFQSLLSSKGLESLKHIGYDAEFQDLVDASGLCNLESIGGNCYFANLSDYSAFKSLKVIGEEVLHSWDKRYQETPQTKELIKKLNLQR